MSYTFDGNSKTITLVAQTVMSVRDVYSRWIDWAVLGDNSKYLPAFNTIGGDTIDVGTSVPIYAYLTNGWRIRPQEANHTLNVTDGVLLVDGGGDPFLNTLGSFIVRINYQQPVQAITVATGGGGGATPTQIADQVWAQLLEDGYSAQQLVSLMAAVLFGKVSGVGAGVETFRSTGDTADRVVS
ncbi:MAG: hypothetical protein ABL859_01730, partial [Methylotenera sp.]